MTETCCASSATSKTSPVASGFRLLGTARGSGKSFQWTESTADADAVFDDMIEGRELKLRAVGTERQLRMESSSC